MSVAAEKSLVAERLAYSISEFCALVGVSRSYFYTLPEDQRPREVRRGGRRLISADAAREWLRSDAAV
jgi:excisionase family DNA binding protein